MKIFLVFTFIMVFAAESSGAKHLKHYPELSVHSRVELFYAYERRIIAAIEGFYEGGESATVHCLFDYPNTSYDEYGNALEIEAMVPDNSFVVQIENGIYCF